MPMARPICAGSCPPGYLAASSANTGRTRNRPSMRAAKTAAKEPLARRSSGVIVAEIGEKEAVFTRQELAGPRAALTARQSRDCPAFLWLQETQQGQGRA